MAKLILDTSTWLDLAKSRFEEVLTELEKQVNDGITVLLTCEIIKDEWKHNKGKVLESIAQSLKDHAKSAMKISGFLEKEDQIILKDLMGKYAIKEKEQMKLADIFFNRVEQLLNSAITYPIPDKLKIEVSEKALNKKAPFHNSKNNMADALLYYGALEYTIKEYHIATDLIFVSSNYTDFSSKDDRDKIHPDLYQSKHSVTPVVFQNIP